MIQSLMLLAGIIACELPKNALPTNLERTPELVIVASSDASVASERLRRLITEESTVKVRQVASSKITKADTLTVILCTKATESDLAKVLAGKTQSAKVPPQGFLIQSDSSGNQIVVIGGDIDGLRYGVGELWHHHTKLFRKSLAFSKNLRIIKSPVYSKRIF